LTDLASKIEEIGNVISTFKDEYSTRLSELERRAARYSDPANDNGMPSVESIGRKLIESEAFKDLNGGRSRGRASVEVAAITSGPATVGAGTSTSTSLVHADRQAGIITPPQRAMVVRDLLAPGRTGSNSIEFVQETGFTNNAAPVAEGEQKPYSDLTFNLENAPVRTIAHLFKASKQILDDAEGLVSHIDVRARYGLEDKVEQQLLRGDGTGQNLHGLILQATPFVPAFTAPSENYIDVLRLAILQVRKAEYRATGIILHPDDLATIDLTKDGEGRYIFTTSIPEGGGNRIWRLPVVDSTVMQPGEFLVGAFAIAAQVFDRWQARVEVSTENTDDFEKNMCTIRAEERLALAVYRPESFVTGTFPVEP
jgi:HK97 family phage major capsid protein